MSVDQPGGWGALDWSVGLGQLGTLVARLLERPFVLHAPVSQVGLLSRLR